jgi:hypothetical protein
MQPHQFQQRYMPHQTLYSIMAAAQSSTPAPNQRSFVLPGDNIIQQTSPPPTLLFNQMHQAPHLQSYGQPQSQPHYTFNHNTSHYQHSNPNATAANNNNNNTNILQFM